MPSGLTWRTRGRLSREGRAYPSRRGVHEFHTVFLFRLSPKVALNPPYASEGVFSFFLLAQQFAAFGDINYGGKTTDTVGELQLTAFQ